MNNNFTPNANGALQEKLIALLGKSQMTHKPVYVVKEKPNTLTPLYKLGIDGVNHINIYDEGLTPLGQLLSLENNLRFSHPHLGPFNNISGLWHYLTIENCPEAIRSYKNTWLRMATKTMSRKVVPNLHAMIMDSIMHRIVGCPILRQAIVESTLPFDMYYYVEKRDGTRKPRRPTIAKWIIEGMEEIRTKLKNKAKPDFTYLMSKPEIKLYEGIPKYTRATHRAKATPISKPIIQTAVDNALFIDSNNEHQLQIEYGRQALETESMHATNIETVDAPTVSNNQVVIANEFLVVKEDASQSLTPVAE